MENVLIFGGSFNPPHCGHLKTALNIQRHFHFDHFIFVPCKTSVLKLIKPASASDRVAMLTTLLKDYPEFTIDTCEIDRETPSYTIETLTHFRKYLGVNAAITLLIGMDSLLELNQWHRWKEIPSHCNLLVMRRSGIQETIPKNILALPNLTQCEDELELKTHANGKLAIFDAGQFEISSTQIRESIRLNQPPLPAVLPSAVYHYIKDHALYQ